MAIRLGGSTSGTGEVTTAQLNTAIDDLRTEIEQDYVKDSLTINDKSLDDVESITINAEDVDGVVNGGTW